MACAVALIFSMWLFILLWQSCACGKWVLLISFACGIDACCGKVECIHVVLRSRRSHVGQVASCHVHMLYVSSREYLGRSVGIMAASTSAQDSVANFRRQAALVGLLLMMLE